MAQVGGVRIPFVVDMSDIPRSVKQVEKNLKKLRKTVGDIDLYIDGTKIDQLNRKTLIPVVENFYELEERAKRAALAIQDIGRAANALRTGKVLSDNFVHSLSQISQVGPATQKAVKSYNLLLKELKLLENQSARSTRKMKVYQTAIRDLGQRKIVGLPYTKVFGEGEKDTAEIPATRLAAQMQAMGMGKEAYQSLKKYEAEYRKLDETRKVGGKRHRAQIAIVNNLRERTIRLLAQEWQQAKKLKTEVTDKQIAQVQTEVNKRRERAIDLLRKAELANKKRLDASKQEVTIVAQPKVTEAKRKEIAYWKEQLRIYDALLLKHKLKTISDRERIALQKQAVIMSKKEGWEDDKRLKLRQRLTREIEIQTRIQRLQQLQKKAELQHEKWLTQEEKKQLELEKKKRGLSGRFPGGGLFSASRVTWFIQLRAFWEVYRVVGKIMSDLVELDEAVARSMRTMASDTENYGQVADRVHATILRTARDTGATYRDVGEALYQLSSAGLSAEESLAAVNSVMRLTRTTEAEVTDATKVIAGVFNNFKESLASASTDTARFNLISSTLSYVWERNQVDMNEMVQALNQAAQVSQLAGVDFTELAVIIGNLGTMMIRSGRAGRSIRTAIIQMAAKGQQLAKVFDFTFDPTQPLNFMRTMDKMHESWKRMSKSAVVAEKVFQIFGRRGAPAIIALLKNWEKVREEIAGAGNDLQLLINQQEKLLRLQERFRQVSETVWKEIMQLVVEYSNVVKALGITLHNYLRGLRLERAIAEAEKSAGELIEIYGDAGKLTEQAAYAFALLKISQEKQAEALAKGIPAWKKVLRYMAAMNLETGKMDEVQITGNEKEIKALKEHAEQLWLSASLQKTLETYYADAQAVKEEATKVIYSEAESWIMLGRELKKHRALRGELVYTEIELQNVMDREVTKHKVVIRN